MRLTTPFAALVMSAAASVLAQPPMPQPGPEHDVLKRDVGVWDVTMEMTAPGMPPFQMTGVETNTLFGGLWMLTEYKSDFMGQVFEQHGISGYVATWPGPDQRVVKLYIPADAPEPFMTMTYKRRK